MPLSSDVVRDACPDDECRNEGLFTSRSTQQDFNCKCEVCGMEWYDPQAEHREPPAL